MIQYPIDSAQKLHVNVESSVMVQSSGSDTIPDCFDFSTFNGSWAHPNTTVVDIFSSFLRARNLQWNGTMKNTVVEMCTDTGYVTYTVPQQYIKQEVLTHGPVITTFDISTKFISDLEESGVGAYPSYKNNNVACETTIPVLIIGWEGADWIISTELPKSRNFNGSFKTPILTDNAYGVLKEITTAEKNPFIFVHIITAEMIGVPLPVSRVAVTVVSGKTSSLDKKHKRKKKQKTEKIVQANLSIGHGKHANPKKFNSNSLAAALPTEFIFSEEDLGVIIQCIIAISMLIICVNLIFRN